MIERRADWKHAEQTDARFFPTISPSAVGERRAGCPPTSLDHRAIVWASPARARDSGILRCPLITQERRLQRTSRFIRKVPQADVPAGAIPAQSLLQPSRLSNFAQTSDQPSHTLDIGNATLRAI
jgi:hypothetical protein